MLSTTTTYKPLFCILIFSLVEDCSCPRLNRFDDEAISSKEEDSSEKQIHSLDADECAREIQSYTEAIERDPSDASTFKQRGNCYLSFALADWTKAVEMDSSDQDRLDHLRQFLIDFLKYDEVIEGKPGTNNDEELIRRGDHLSLKKKFKEALHYYDRAIKKNAENPLYYYKRGNCHLDLQDTDSALSDFRIQVRLKPDDINGWYALTQTLFRLKRVDEVMEETRILSDAKLAELAKRFFIDKKYDEALRFYIEAAIKNPSEASHFRQQGYCYLAMKNNMNMAISMLREGMTKDPQNQIERISLIQTMINARQFVQAIEEMKSLDGEQLLILGNRFYASHKYEEAIHCYNEAINKNSENAMLYEKRANCHRILKHFKEAILDYRNVIRLEPSSAAAFDLSDLFLGLGRCSDSKKVLDDFVEKNHENLKEDDIARLKKIRDSLRDIERTEKLIRRQNSLSGVDSSLQANSYRHNSPVHQIVLTVQ